MIITKSLVFTDTYVDPTGTYVLNKNIKKVEGDIYGYFGEIQVAKLDRNKIVMNFSICKGAPSYNSGAFLDTLLYQNNKAIFRGDTIDDPSCMITFNFSAKGIVVEEKTDDYNFGCGFGHAVVASGFFKKTSSKVPVIDRDK